METTFLSNDQLHNLSSLCARYRVRRLGLFGSAATGTFDPSTSDFDFTVEFDPPQDMGLADQFFGFQAEAAQLLGRKVDLLERSAIQNPILRHAIEQEEKVLYVATSRSALV